jgi:hypothetical protein
MEFTRTITVNAPAEQVWTVFAHGFDDAYKWMASVPNSYGKENGTSFDGASSAGRGDHAHDRKLCAGLSHSDRVRVGSLNRIRCSGFGRSRPDPNGI